MSTSWLGTSRVLLALNPSRDFQLVYQQTENKTAITGLNWIIVFSLSHSSRSTNSFLVQMKGTISVAVTTTQLTNANCWLKRLKIPKWETAFCLRLDCRPKGYRIFIFYHPMISSGFFPPSLLSLSIFVIKMLTLDEKLCAGNNEGPTFIDKLTTRAYCIQKTLHTIWIEYVDQDFN